MNDPTRMEEAPKSDAQKETAVPYIPPPPPVDSSQKKFRSPAVNGALIAFVILIGGFMTYNAIGHSLTHLSAATSEISPTVPSISPTITPTR